MSNTTKPSMRALRHQAVALAAQLTSMGKTKLAYDPANVSVYTRGQLNSMILWAQGTVQHVVWAKALEADRQRIQDRMPQAKKSGLAVG